MEQSLPPGAFQWQHLGLDEPSLSLLIRYPISVKLGLVDEPETESQHVEECALPYFMFPKLAEHLRVGHLTRIEARENCLGVPAIIEGDHLTAAAGGAAPFGMKDQGLPAGIAGDWVAIIPGLSGNIRPGSKNETASRNTVGPIMADFTATIRRIARTCH